MTQAAQRSLNFIKSKRVVLVTGKGGVGRSTMTAAIASAAARLGRRALVVEIGDPDGDYSPLAQLFDRPTLPLLPEELMPGVSGCVLHAPHGHALFMQRVLPVASLVKAGMRSKALRRLFAAAPSLHEMGVFNHLLSLLQETRSDGEPTYDLVVADMPATGHALALTSLPATLLRLLPTGPVADLLKEGQAILNDPRTTTAVVVTLPEQLPVSESLELIDGLRETRMPVGPVLVNKVVEDVFSADERSFLTRALGKGAFFGETRFLALAEAGTSLRRLHEHAGVPIMELPEFPSMEAELVSDMASALLEASDP